MPNPAVTEDAPAVSELETPQSAEESLETGFLPDDPTYRLTGAFKEKKPEVEAEKPQEAPAPSGEQDAETAAASETAEPQEQPQPQKTAQTSESRWAKLSRENRELRERLARAEGRAEATAQREPQRTSQTATEAKPARPKIDDVDANGKPKFATYEDYENARDEWNRKEWLRESQEASSKAQREQQMQQAKETIARTFNEKVVTARTKYADFDEIALNTELPIKEGSVADVFILDSPHGTDVLYYLGQNPAELDRINALNPIAQARELVKIELKVSGQGQAPVTRVTQAPRPPHQVSGKGAVVKDPIEQALEDGDSETYSRLQNARELARLRGK